MRPSAWLLCAANLLALSPMAVGQQVQRFDSAYVNQEGGFAFGLSVFERDSGYMVFSVQKPIGAPSQDLYVSDYDTIGRWLNDRRTVTERSDWIGNYSPVQQMNAAYFSGMTRFAADYEDSLFLVKWDPQGDTLFTRFIATDTTYLMRGTAFTRDTTILLTGTHEQPREAYVYEVDTSGNILAFHTYSGFYPEDVAVGADGSWYLTGLGFIGAADDRGIVTKCNTLGVEQWRRWDSVDGVNYQAIPTEDSGVVVMGYRTAQSDPLRSKVAKYNSAGVQLWVKEPIASNWHFGPGSFYAGIENPDGTLLVAGALRDTIRGYSGMLFMLDSEGNTIWQRFYAHYPSFTEGDEHFFYDVKRTRDGGLILTGETNGGDFPYAQLWLLKLDSLGCLVPGCQSVGVEEYTDLFAGQLAISPNPAREQVRVSLTLPEGFATTGVLQLYLMDAQGRIVLHQIAQTNLNIISGSFDVSGLASGTYYVHLADAKRWLAGGKVIVE